MKYVEFIAICLIAFAAFAAHCFFSGVPNIALIFDAPGFLFTADGCLHAFTPDAFAKIGAYLAHGCNAVDRAALAQLLSPAADLVKHGPVTPGVLALVYKLAGVSAVSANWKIGAMTMIGFMALTVGMAWLIGNDYFDKTVARLAVLLSLLYSGFVLNSVRMYSEMPAAFALLFAVWAFLRAGFSDFDDEKRSLKQQVVNGLLIGTAVALVVLSRAILLFVPLALIAALVVLRRHALKASSVKTLSALVLSSLASCLVFLAPWMLFKQIMTGSPSIVIERHGVYNLYAGLSVVNDGFDVLPSEYVAHPEAYHGTAGDAVKQIVQEAVEAPLQFVGLMIRKPARIADEPWNDFQTSCWGIPWKLQVWFHQALLLLGGAGCVFAFARPDGSADKRTRVAAGMLATVVLYHLIYCAFIAMPRYLFTAMPEIILLAAAGAVTAARALSRRQAIAFWSLTLALPTFCLLTDVFSRPDNQLLQQLAGMVGGDLVGVTVAAVIAMTLAAWFVALSKVTAQAGDSRWRRALFVGLGGLAAVSCFLSTQTSLRSLDLAIRHQGGGTAAGARAAGCIGMPLVTADFDLKTVKPDERLFLLVDCRADEKSSSYAPIGLIDCGADKRELKLHPLFGWDASQRESMVYEREFAEAMGSDPQTFRQWWGAELPAELRSAAKGGKPLHISLDLDARFVLGSDLSSAGAAPVSLTRYSWTKGFMCNPPGEMRVRAADAQHADQRALRRGVPRVCLLVVPSVPLAASAGKAAEVVALPDFDITTEQSKRILDYSIGRQPLDKALAAAAVSGGDDLELIVQGQVRSDAADAQPSVGLVEDVDTHNGVLQQLAPLAPRSIACRKTWTDFEFADLIPLSSAGEGERKLRSLRLLALGTPWYEALQYAQFKPRRPVQFRNVKVLLRPVKLFNMQKDSWRVVSPLN